MKTPEEIEAYLARIRRTVADSNELLETARLRMQETDRLLASQGLTREQVMGFRITREQRLLVNEELCRRGLPPLEEEETSYDFGAATEQLRAAASAPEPPPEDGELAERQRKFGAFMREFRI